MPHQPTQPNIGVNLRVTGHCNQGGRRYMEDAFAVAYQQTGDDLEYAYFGIFDGHGGREAALFAKEHLMNAIVGQKNFWSEDDDLILKSISQGFLATHAAMWKQVSNWPQTVSGLPSTSGTTASVIFIRKGKMYVGHVGDSAIVLGYKDPDGKHFGARPLTSDHKPETPTEKKRIEDVGGCVMSKCGVQRVVWNRPRIGHKGPVRRSTHIDQIPFLAVARSLGDLWSYDYFHQSFIVSPEPDVHVVTLDTRRDRCLVLATDGVWNMVSYKEAVRIVEAAERENERQFLSDETRQIGCKPWVNPSKLLVDRALSLWILRKKRADNTSVVTVMLDPPGPPRSEVLRRRRMMQKLRPRDELSTFVDAASPSYSQQQTPSCSAEMSRILVTSDITGSCGSGGGSSGDCGPPLPPKIRSHVINTPTLSIPSMATRRDVDLRRARTPPLSPATYSDRPHNPASTHPVSLQRTARLSPQELAEQLREFASYGAPGAGTTDSCGSVDVKPTSQSVGISGTKDQTGSIRRLKRKLPLPSRSTRTGLANKHSRLYRGHSNLPACHITRSRLRLQKVQM